MFKPYHTAKDNKEKFDTTNIEPVDVMATFNPEGRFRIDYMRTTLPTEERVTVKLLELKREVVQEFWIEQEYSYILKENLCSVTIVYHIGDHRFYIKKKN